MDENSVFSVYYENSYQFDKRNTNKEIILHKKLHISFSFTNIYPNFFKLKFNLIIQLKKENTS